MPEVTRVSIVSPCYREEANIAPLVKAVDEALQGSGVAWELILVNDGSPDRTWDEIRRASVDPRVRGLNLSRNFGKEAAMYAGLQAALGDAVVIMDADLQHPPALIPELIQVMQEQQVDQVVAKRTRDGENPLRKWFSRLYYRLVRSLMDVELEDGVGDFRLLSRRAVDALLELAEVNRFSKGLFAWIGFQRASVEYRNVQRHGGQSSWSFFSLVNYGVDGVIAFNERPLRIAVHGGIGAVVLGLFYLTWLFVVWVAHGVEAPGYLTTIAAIVLLGGFQLIVLGVMGEYIGRIHSEVKRRPIYLVADTTNDPKLDTAKGQS